MPQAQDEIPVDKLPQNRVTGIGAAATIGREVDNKISYGDNLTWQKGAHLLKFGAQAVRYRQNRYYAGNNGALGLFVS